MHHRAINHDLTRQRHQSESPGKPASPIRSPAEPVPRGALPPGGPATRPGPWGGGRGSSPERRQAVFHELHPDGSHALCPACASSC